MSLETKQDQDKLWTVEDIAAYLQYSVTYVRQKIVNEPDFPERVQKLKSSRWLKYDVIKHYTGS